MSEIYIYIYNIYTSLKYNFSRTCDIKTEDKILISKTSTAAGKSPAQHLLHYSMYIYSLVCQ